MVVHVRPAGGRTPHSRSEGFSGRAVCSLSPGCTQRPRSRMSMDLHKAGAPSHAGPGPLAPQLVLLVLLQPYPLPRACAVSGHGCILAEDQGGGGEWTAGMLHPRRVPEIRSNACSGLEGRSGGLGSSGLCHPPVGLRPLDG